MYKIGFICVHNSCRSQMAEAICKQEFSDYFEAYSAGTNLKSEINPDAVITINNMYQVDISKTQFNKLIDDIPDLDIVITMGCNVECPHLPCKYREDFGLKDPTGHELFSFELTAEIIRLKLEKLKAKLTSGELKII